MISPSDLQSRPFRPHRPGKMNGQRLALPWRTKIALSFLSFVTDATRRSDGTINRRLGKFIDVKAPPNPRTVNGVKTSDVTVDASRNLWFRLFVPDARDGGLPVVLFFHGGGFTFLGPDSKAYDAVCRRFARELPAVVVSVNYRLSPEHKFPAQYDDGFDVLMFLDGGGGGLPEGADMGRCFLAGDSAGANLCHQVALRAAGRVRVAGVVSIQPFFGGEERTAAEVELRGAPLVSVEVTDWLWRALLPGGCDRDHAAVNVSGPNAAEIGGVAYPATMVVVGGWDPLQEWQRRYYEWLRRWGKAAEVVEYPNAIHAFYVFPELPESSLLVTEVRNFIRRQQTPSYALGPKLE